MILRAAIVVTLLVGTGMYTARAGSAEATVERTPLASLPLQLGPWQGRDATPFDDDIVAKLGVDDYVNRQYISASGAPIGVYIGYYVSQRQGDTIHSPQNCLPDAGWRLDGGWGIVRPGTDQLPGSCYDYLSAGRWADLSNATGGVTLSLSESPLVELGAMTDETEIIHMLRSWRTSLPPGTTLYSYAMNNYWHTNYAASQEGPAALHYALTPHGRFSAAAAYKAGVEQSQPLLVRLASRSARLPGPLFSIENADVVVTSVMPSADGKAAMVRLFNAGETTTSCRIKWGSLSPKKVWLSDLKEEAGKPAPGEFSLPRFGILTLRCDR